MSTTEYCIAWDSYKTSVSKGFTRLQQNAEFVDMTFAAEDHLVKVHQNIVALASPYLKAMLQSASCQHPVIFLSNISHKTLEYLLEYIYTGEARVPKNDLSNFFAACKGLHISGVENFYLPKKLNPDPPDSNLPDQQEFLNENPRIDEPGINGTTVNQFPTVSLNTVHLDPSESIITQIQPSNDRIMDLNENDVEMEDTDFELAIDKAIVEAKRLPPIETPSKIIPALYETPENMPVDHTYHHTNLNAVPDFAVANNNFESAVQPLSDDFAANIVPTVSTEPQPNFAAHITINNGKLEIVPLTSSLSTEDKSLSNITFESGGCLQNRSIENKQDDIENCGGTNNVTFGKEARSNILNGIEYTRNIPKKPENKEPPVELKDDTQYYSISNRGSLQLIFNRYIYLCHQRSVQNKRRWRCKDYRKLNCRAFIDTENENIVERFGTHDHSFHDSKIRKQIKSGKIFNSLGQTQDNDK